MDAEYIVLLPSSEIEGSCNLSLNEVQNKLIFQIQDKEKFQELKKYIISTIDMGNVSWQLAWIKISMPAFRSMYENLDSGKW